MSKGTIEIPSDIILRAIISKNMKELRDKHGLTQEKLAELTGIHRVTIVRYEKCQRLVSLENLLIIAKALNESPMAFLEGWESSLE